MIKEIFEEHKGSYGYRRIDTELRNRGHIVNPKKILRLMRKLNIKCIKFTRKSRKFSTYKGKIGKITKNLIKDRKSTRLNSSHVAISYAVFCLKKKCKI